MKAVRARYDGRQVVIEGDLGGLTPGDVLVIFDTSSHQAPDWITVQEEVLSRVWDNDEDAVYDSL